MSVDYFRSSQLLAPADSHRPQARSRRTPGPPAASTGPHALQILTTEHLEPAAARGLGYTEAMSRALAHTHGRTLGRRGRVALVRRAATASCAGFVARVSPARRLLPRRLHRQPGSGRTTDEDAVWMQRHEPDPNATRTELRAGARAVLRHQPRTTTRRGILQQSSGRDARSPRSAPPAVLFAIPAASSPSIELGGRRARAPASPPSGLGLGAGWCARSAPLRLSSSLISLGFVSLLGAARSARHVEQLVVRFHVALLTPAAPYHAAMAASRAVSAPLLLPNAHGARLALIRSSSSSSSVGRLELGGGLDLPRRRCDRPGRRLPRTALARRVAVRQARGSARRPADDRLGGDPALARGQASLGGDGDHPPA